MSRKPLFVILVLGGCISCAARAVPDSDIPIEKAQLLEFLEEQTELATKTRLNADYVPGIMTVLHGHDLEAKGIRTIWDAIELVPGITRSIGPGGRPQLIVRGLSASMASGNVKVLLNGISVNTAREGRADPVFSIPVEQVERLEFIRGPGSAVHGEYAYAGVLNVTTYDDANRVFGGVDGNDTRSAGALLSFRQGELNLGLSFSAWDSDGPDVEAGRDALYQSTGNLESASFAPGETNEKAASRTAVAKAELGRLTLLGQWTEKRSGDYFGINYILPPPEDRIVSTETLKSIELRYRAPLSAKLSTEMFAGTVNARTLVNDLYSAPSEAYFDPGEPPVTVDSDYEETRIYAGIDTIWVKDAHTVLLGLGFSEVEVDQDVLKSNVVFVPIPAPPHFDVLEQKVEYPGAVSPPGTDRDVVSVTLQDEFRASDDFTLTTGLRYDHYDQIGDGLAPRIAGVWRLNERNIVKLQFGRAFRPPTLREQLFTASELDPSLINTVEFGYINKDNRGERRVTVAYSKLDDLVVYTPENAPDFHANAASSRLFSTEVEFQERLSSRLMANGNLSYVRTEDGQTGEALPLTSRWFGNLGVQYRLVPGTYSNFRYRYVDDYAREVNDP